MAKVTATVFKAQMATAATALTVAWKDDTLTEVAVEYKNNHHPLRIIKRLFNFDPATGSVTSNDAYIDEAYAGRFPNKGTDFGVNAD